MYVNSACLFPISDIMAAFTRSLTIKGPGVNNFLRKAIPVAFCKFNSVHQKKRHVKHFYLRILHLYAASNIFNKLRLCDSLYL